MEQLQKVSAIKAPKIIHALRVQIKELKKENEALLKVTKKAEKRINLLRLRILKKDALMNVWFWGYHKVFNGKDNDIAKRDAVIKPIKQQKEKQIDSILDLKKNLPFLLARQEVKKIIKVGRIKY